MLSHFFFSRGVSLYYASCIHLDLMCQPSKTSAVYLFFPSFLSSLHAITAQYLKLSCDHMPVGAACTEEPVFNSSSKLKGEILQFHVHHNQAFTSENIIAFLCFMQCIACSFSLVIQVVVPSNCLGGEKIKIFMYL